MQVQAVGEGPPVVSFVTRILTHYRLPFHEKVRDLLEKEGCRYRLIHGQPDVAEAAKGDLATFPWAEQIENKPVLGQSKLIWQPIGHVVRDSDLLILGQENQLLVNYTLQLRPTRSRPRIALFGHGRNFQSRNPEGAAERWKRFWATRCDWWFAYTEETRMHVEKLGFPADRITVFNNAVDTSELSRLATEAGPAEIRAALDAVGVKGGNVAIFVGGLYAEKRLEFLVSAADIVRAQIVDFELIIVGGGTERSMLERMAASRPWIHVVGPRFGREKVALMKGAKLFLMPGLVGLAVLDAAALELPVVTTSFPYHSPEIAYLEHGGSGLIVEPYDDVAAYASAVSELLASPDVLRTMAQRAKEIAEDHTIDEMAQRFASGVLEALA